VAGELLGLRMLYLDAGSGAGRPVPPATVAAVREATAVPLIVGGGLRDGEAVERAWAAGADCAVLGTAVESDSRVLDRLPQRLEANV
jgi:geranylgeranylglyceryl phosphate synthase family protein